MSPVAAPVLVFFRISGYRDNSSTQQNGEMIAMIRNVSCCCSVLVFFRISDDLRDSSNTTR